jgi:hypothetical protein
MNTIRSLLGSIIFVFTLVSCATPPTPDQINRADYGPEISTDTMTTAVKNMMSKRLIDPYSAVYSCTPPVKAWMIGGTGDESNVQMDKTYYGSLSACSINAKNKFGGYTGATEYSFMIYRQDGTLHLGLFSGNHGYGYVQQ